MSQMCQYTQKYIVVFCVDRKERERRAQCVLKYAIRLHTVNGYANTTLLMINLSNAVPLYSDFNWDPFLSEVAVCKSLYTTICVSNFNLVPQHIPFKFTKLRKIFDKKMYLQLQKLYITHINFAGKSLSLIHIYCVPYSTKLTNRNLMYLCI